MTRDSHRTSWKFGDVEAFHNKPKENSKLVSVSDSRSILIELNELYENMPKRIQLDSDVHCVINPDFKESNLLEKQDEEWEV